MPSVKASIARHRADWHDAIVRYAELRELAAQQTAVAVADEYGVLVSFRSISALDIAMAERWTLGRHGRGWSWCKEVSKARRRSRCFDAALETFGANQRPTVTALILGRVSKSRVVASLHFLERAPNPNPLAGTVAPIAIRYLEFCAIAFGCRSTSLQRPVEALVSYYKQLGYTRVVRKKGKIIRLERDLHRDLLSMDAPQ